MYLYVRLVNRNRNKYLQKDTFNLNDFLNTLLRSLY